MNVDSVEVTSSLQQSLGDVITARQSCPVQADVLLLNKEQIRGQYLHRALTEACDSAGHSKRITSQVPTEDEASA